MLKYIVFDVGEHGTQHHNQGVEEKNGTDFQFLNRRVAIPELSKNVMWRDP